MEVKPVNGEASQANLTHAALLTFGLKHILDYSDLVVAPGLIDTHVHMDQPGRTNWEGGAACIARMRLLRESSHRAVNLLHLSCHLE